MDKVNFLTRIHLKGTVPSNFSTLFKEVPNKKLSGTFFTALGFNRLGKSFTFEGKTSQVVFLDCNHLSCKDSFSDAVIFFFKFHNRESYEHIFDTFDLNKDIDDTTIHQRTIIGIHEPSEVEIITQAERKQLRANKNINYHEILSSDTKKLEEIIINVIKKSFPLDQVLLKIVCLGSTMRKTEIIQNYTDGNLSTDYLSTLGVDLTNKRLNINGLRVKLIIVDTAGFQSFEKLRPKYYRGAKGGIIFFDFDDRTSIHSIKNWQKELTNNTSGIIPIILAGVIKNNSDFYIDEVKAIAQELELDLYGIEEDSTKIRNLMENMTKQILIGS